MATVIMLSFAEHWEEQTGSLNDFYPGVHGKFPAHEEPPSQGSHGREPGGINATTGGQGTIINYAEVSNNSTVFQQCWKLSTVDV